MSAICDRCIKAIYKKKLPDGTEEMFNTQPCVSCGDDADEDVPDALIPDGAMLCRARGFHTTKGTAACVCGAAAPAYVENREIKLAPVRRKASGDNE